MGSSVLDGDIGERTIDAEFSRVLLNVWIEVGQPNVLGLSNTDAFPVVTECLLKPIGGVSPTHLGEAEGSSTMDNLDKHFCDAKLSFASLGTGVEQIKLRGCGCMGVKDEVLAFLLESVHVLIEDVVSVVLSKEEKLNKDDDWSIDFALGDVVVHGDLERNFLLKVNTLLLSVASLTCKAKLAASSMKVSRSEVLEDSSVKFLGDTEGLEKSEVKLS